MVFPHRPSEISFVPRSEINKACNIQLNRAVSLYHVEGSVRAQRSEILSCGRHTCGRRNRTSGMAGICCRAPLRLGQRL